MPNLTIPFLVGGAILTGFMFIHPAETPMASPKTCSTVWDEPALRATLPECVSPFKLPKVEETSRVLTIPANLQPQDPPTIIVEFSHQSKSSFLPTLSTELP